MSIKMTRRLFMATVPAALASTAIPAFAVPLTDLQLIARQQGEPSIIQLARALERLTSTVTFMTTGAHPDDEPSGMLAALRFNYGIHPVMYCMTRGEGGQNSIGPERGIALGVLRTREMQAASRALDAALAFGGMGTTDPVHDFGFTKDPDDTIERWGEDRVLERMVWAFRAYRPDAIFNCFLDTPGQHGQHRAATVATKKAVELSGRDDVYTHHFTELGLTPWEVPKMYDPAWGGGGGVYDDETPPPPQTLLLTAPERDKISGATWPQMGEWSRSCHLTQGMGRWRPEPQTEWPLHLARVIGGGAGGAENDIRDGLLATVGALATMDGMPEDCAAALREAQDLIDAAHGDYGDPESVLEKAVALANALDAATAALPETLAPQVAHRLTRKQREVAEVIRIAAGVQIRSFVDGNDVPAGQSVEIRTLVDAPASVTVDLVEVLTAGDLPTSEGTDGKVKVDVPTSAALTNPMEPQYDPLGGNGDAWMRVTFSVGGRAVTVVVDLEDALRIVPENSLTLRPEALVFNMENGAEPAEIEAVVTNATIGDLVIPVPETWVLSGDADPAGTAATFRLAPPSDLSVARLVLNPTLKGKTAYKVETFQYPHTGKAVVPSEVAFQVQVVDAKIPEARVAYIGSNNDNVATWIRRLGVDLTELTPEDMASGAYRDFDTIVVGVFALGRRRDFTSRIAEVHEWIAAGGHLVTLYHRPSDGWNPDTVPAARLVIGSPSIRYRVTDPNAAVTVLAPDHPLLNQPNVISADDWAGWDKERGLYFASEWDAAYVSLLAMNDRGEEPLEGSLLSAEVGAGRHTHTALVLHHQLDKLTPGAFRILANLLQKA
ncbi:PIG-L family deacetylase [Ketogulonicigenium vulgare]|uniref:GlcNAc-PI de-N-acetylase family protein n=1 Tax=Ketogulonicigenium vulgare (strain WSH-001) TaxID=759362 RepID=F9Y787_KETVW|nr:PIG-L family deacetylase [Ketogulonicigenium vulgare]ADO41613.1 LmbE family protein [Ketogulonicigenium vulgare Y25]AEM39854.1 GlcNAc-PI de-N-acetylase family protein [Ketogulonicigenium vulgare WSH-001]ALJ80069.1 GlcNAc-PI de-N-acetylase [Ketogulonicigenium vulgare]ANW32946.1 GlcNAc-PI de-N-acetylase [Ketogulonicigenium vulgare]AOZ53543.1 LmbE family protein [Ketogulonicigenium vulgare]